MKIGKIFSGLHMRLLQRNAHSVVDVRTVWSQEVNEEHHTVGVTFAVRMFLIISKGVSRISAV